MIGAKGTSAPALALSALCTLLAPGPSNAQTDQLIVMSCTNNQVQFNTTIDLAAKTVVMNGQYTCTSTTPLSRITDQQVDWTCPITSFSGAVLNDAFTLNRYSGELTDFHAGTSLKFAWRRQQKQF